MSFDEIVHRGINQGMGTYTVGPSNLDHVIDLITHDIRTSKELTDEIHAAVARSYSGMLRKR